MTQAVRPRVLLAPLQIELTLSAENRTMCSGPIAGKYSPRATTALY
jgi:hypothetical protein